MSSRTAELKVKVSSESSQAAKSVDSFGSKVAGFAKKAVKTGAAIAGALGAAALWKGFQRLTAIDDAQAKLRGLGYSAKQVEKIMSNANAAVKGTAFGLGDAATAAAGAVAAGVKPGKDLQKTLTLIGDAATIAGTDFASMGSIFNKVAASNKIQGDTIAQLSDQGIPIIKMLSKELGVSAGKVTELASKGKINFKQFQSAMETGLGGAAQESGKTFTGALRNVWAAMGRLGASVLGGVFSQLPALFGRVIVWLDKIGPTATAAGQMAGRAFAGFGRAVQRVAQSKLFQDLVDSVIRFGKSIGRAFTTAGPALKQIARLLAPLVAGAAAAAIIGLTAAFDTLGPVIEAAAKVFAKLVEWAGDPVIQGAAAVIAAIFTVAMGPVILFNAQMAIAAARIIAFGAAETVVTTATKAWAVAQRLLNASLLSNPIFLIIAALVALGVALVVAYKKSQTFRNIVNGAFAAVKVAAAAVGRAFQAIGRAAEVVFKWIKSHWRLVAAILFGPVGIAVGVITKHWSKIRATATVLLSWIKSAFRTAFSGVASTVRTQITIAKTVIKTVRDAVQAVVTKVGSLIAKLKNIKVPGAIKTAIDKIASAVQKVVDAVGSLISKIQDIPTPHINWPDPPGWFSKLNPLSAALPPVPQLPGPRALVAPAVSMPRGVGAPRPAASYGAGGITINVTGALDPEAVARQIQRVLAGHHVRIGATA